MTLDEASGRMRKSTHSDSCVNQSVADEVGAGRQHAPGCGPKPDWSGGSPRMRGGKLPFPWLLDLLKLSRKTPVDLLRAVDPPLLSAPKKDSEAPQLK